MNHRSRDPWPEVPAAESLTIAQQVERKVVADHARAAGRRHYCRFVIGYIGDTDNQQELELEPPIIVTVDECRNPEQMLFNDTGEYMDPYWDVTPVKPVDPRVANLRSMYTYAPSYDMKTGLREPRDDTDPMIWRVKFRCHEKLIAFVQNLLRKKK